MKQSSFVNDFAIKAVSQFYTAINPSDGARSSGNLRGPCGHFFTEIPISYSDRGAQGYRSGGFAASCCCGIWFFTKNPPEDYLPDLEKNIELGGLIIQLIESGITGF